MDLYLIRHGVAFKRDPERWPDDAERPLTPEGEADFRMMAQDLGRLASGVEVLLSSPYARAWRTAEILDEESSWPAPVVFPALEPAVPPYKLTAALATYSGAETLAIVGHRPSLHELAAYLLSGSEDSLNLGLKKGGAACIRFKDGPERGAGKLRWLLTPQVLRAIRSA